DWRAGIGAIALLVADCVHEQEAGAAEPGKFALYRAAAAAGALNELADRKGPLRTPEQPRQHALLGAREQGTGEARGAVPRACFADLGSSDSNTHKGHGNARSGHAQSSTWVQWLSPWCQKRGPASLRGLRCIAVRRSAR